MTRNMTRNNCFIRVRKHISMLFSKKQECSEFKNRIGLENLIKGNSNSPRGNRKLIDRPDVET